jgi:hypothetical protein
MFTRNRLGLMASIWPGSMLPVSFSSLAQLIAVLIAPPNCLAALLRDIPPFIAATARYQRSREYGAPIRACLLPSQHDESEKPRFENPKSIQPVLHPA